jgi:hypothetical protein
MQEQATATARDFKSQEVANSLWALATMGVQADPRLLGAMQEQATVTARDFKPQGVANLVWALSTMGVKADRRLLDAVQGHVSATARDYIPQDVANLLWGLACFGISQSPGSSRMAESMAGRLLSQREQLSVENKCQVHLWLLFCDLHPEWRGQLPRSMQRVKEELGGNFRQAFTDVPWTSRSQVVESLFSAPLHVGVAVCVHGGVAVCVHLSLFLSLSLSLSKGSQPVVWG